MMEEVVPPSIVTERQWLAQGMSEKKIRLETGVKIMKVIEESAP